MDDFTSVADLLATPHELEYQGKVYKLKPLDLAGMAEYQRWLERGAIASALALSADFPPDQADRYLASVSRDIGAKKYAWGGELCEKSRREPAGVVKQLQIVLARNHPEVDEDFAREMLNDAVTQRVLKLMEDANSTDPKVRERVRTLVVALGLNPKFLDELSSSLPTRPSSSAPTASAGSPSTS